MKLKKRKHVETDSDERLYLATWLMMDVTASIANAIDAKGLQQKDIAKRLGMITRHALHRYARRDESSLIESVRPDKRSAPQATTTDPVSQVG